MRQLPRGLVPEPRPERVCAVLPRLLPVRATENELLTVRRRNGGCEYRNADVHRLPSRDLHEPKQVGVHPVLPRLPPAEPSPDPVHLVR